MILVFTFEDASDAKKFEYIYRKYKGLLFHKAYGILHDKMAAEDALSETMIRVYRNMNKIGDPDSPKSAAFLAIIVRNVSLTLRRKQMSEPELIDMMTDGDEPENDFADSSDLEASVIDRITEDRLCVILRKLDEESRDMFILKYAYDLPHKEIAAQLDLTESNVSVRLYRTRKKLAAMALEGGFFTG